MSWQARGMPPLTTSPESQNWSSAKPESLRLAYAKQAKNHSGAQMGLGPREGLNCSPWKGFTCRRNQWQTMKTESLHRVEILVWVLNEPHPPQFAVLEIQSRTLHKLGTKSTQWSARAVVSLNNTCSSQTLVLRGSQMLMLCVFLNLSFF